MATSSSPSFLDNECSKYGCPPLVPLHGEPGPAQLSYLDLVRARRAPSSKKRLLPEAVAEFQERPLLYVVDAKDSSAPTPKLHELQQLLANRGEHAYVALVQLGQMTVYPVNLDPSEIANSVPEVIKLADERAPLFFQSLAAGTQTVPGMPREADYVYDKIHTLLEGASAQLTGPRGKPLKPLEVLSTTGRALFFRCLYDRGIVRAGDLPSICPQAQAGDLRDVFSDAKKAAATSAWLDETFNGDLLPLVDGINPQTSPTQRRQAYLSFYETAGVATRNRLFAHLEAILRGWEGAGASNFQYTINWNDLNFAHIPIGVLSQVYETFSHQWDTPHAVETSIHYTPRKIAQLVVSESLAGIQKPARAQILDPACGAGVFLAIALRELVRHRWAADKRRPSKEVIHKILYEQLCGFDVSEHALRLAALGLYITAIELNSIHRPPSLHHAPGPLQGRVLHNFDDPSAHASGRRRFVSGSLESTIKPEFNGRFDVVVGNPPWTPLSPQGKTANERHNDADRIKALNDQFTALGKRALAKRGFESLARKYVNPNNAPDLPFLWRATEWAKPNGILGFTLDARFILKQDRTYRKAREAVLHACKVTGIFNGSDLEETDVWPGMKMPFIALFARNAVPSAGHSFHLLTPIRENALCERGEFRLDYTSVQTVPIAEVERYPWLLKTLTIGTSLDVAVMEKLVQSFGGRTIGSTWKPPLYTGRGFELGSPGGTQKSPDWLCKLPLFEAPENLALPDFQKLKSFGETHGTPAVAWPRNPRIYEPPIVLIPQTPGEDRSTSKSYRSLTRRIAYDQSVYGYSAAAHPDGVLNISLLHVLAHSTLFRFWCLARSSRIGASWRTFIKEDIDAFPFPDVSQLAEAQRRKVVQFADLLDAGPVSDWSPLDSLVYKLYHLAEAEIEVVEDTVTFRSPYRSTRIPAEQPPTTAELKAFCARLEELLQPLFSLTYQKVEVSILAAVSDHDTDGWLPPWRFASITLAGQPKVATPALLARLMRAATSASRIIMRVPGGGLMLGLLNQRRFWTFSRARLCAVEVAREHLDWFPLAPAATRSRTGSRMK